MKTNDLIDSLIENPPANPRYLNDDKDIHIWQRGWLSALKTLKAKLIIQEEKQDV